MSDIANFCFVKDDDSHWYLIPTECRARFRQLLHLYEKAENMDVIEDIAGDIEDEFDGYRCQDPREYYF